MFSRHAEPQYAPLEKTLDADEDRDVVCAHCECECGRARSRAELIALATSAVLAIALAVVLISRLGHGTTCSARSSETDFGTAAFDENGTAYRLTNPNEPQYVGPPNPDIDAAWDALISGRNFYITEKEAKSAWGEGYTDYYMDEHGIRAELDVLHTLHCVNKIRQALSPEYYFLSPSSAFNRYHFDHCIDIIRQSVQCNGDLTLIPTKWFEGAHRRFIDSDQVHTCRNFQKIRDWTTERHNGSTAVYKIGVSTTGH